METINVDNSTYIRRLSYEEKTGALQITFSDGKTFEYSGVSPETWENYKNAASKGKFFHQYIKGKYSDIEI